MARNTKSADATHTQAIKADATERERLVEELAQEYGRRREIRATMQGGDTFTKWASGVAASCTVLVLAGLASLYVEFNKTIPVREALIKGQERIATEVKEVAKTGSDNSKELVAIKEQMNGFKTQFASLERSVESYRAEQQVLQRTVDALSAQMRFNTSAAAPSAQPVRKNSPVNP